MIRDSEALSRIMAADLRDTGVTVNLLTPTGKIRRVELRETATAALASAESLGLRASDAGR